MVEASRSGIRAADTGTGALGIARAAPRSARARTVRIRGARGSLLRSAHAEARRRGDAERGLHPDNERNSQNDAKTHAVPSHPRLLPDFSSRTHVTLPRIRRGCPTILPIDGRA